MPYDPSSLDWQQLTEQPQPRAKRRVYEYVFRTPWRRIAVTQSPVELLTGSTGNALLTQAPVEIIVPADTGRAMDWFKPPEQPYPYRKALRAGQQQTTAHMVGDFTPPPPVVGFADLSQLAVEVLAPSDPPGWESDWQQPQSQPYPFRKVLRAALQQWIVRQTTILAFAKSTQEPIEVISGSSGNVLVTQQPIEVIVASPAPGYLLDWVQQQNQPYPYRKRLTPANQTVGVLPPVQPPAIAKSTQAPVEILLASPAPGWELDWVQPTFRPYPHRRTLPAACQRLVTSSPPVTGAFVKVTQGPIIEMIVGYQYQVYTGWLGTSVSVG